VKHLAGKQILITGVLTRRSIAFAVAEACQAAGAEVVLTSFGRSHRSTARTAGALPAPVEILDFDASSEASYDRLASQVAERWDHVDGVLHAIAYGSEDVLGGGFVAADPQAVESSFRVSAYSLNGLVRGLLPLLRSAPVGASVVGLAMDASRAYPGYDWMGVSKAALESVNRYLAAYLGPDDIRSNLVSCGPVDTAAAGAFPGFSRLAEQWAARPRSGGIWMTPAQSPTQSASCSRAPRARSQGR
jgi:enoyl-[acyl-carrier protein] reductase I